MVQFDNVAELKNSCTTETFHAPTHYDYAHLRTKVYLDRPFSPLVS